MIQSAGGQPSVRSRHGVPPGGLGALLSRVAAELRTGELALISPRPAGQAARRRPDPAA